MLERDVQLSLDIQSGLQESFLGFLLCENHQHTDDDQITGNGEITRETCEQRAEHYGS